MSHQDECPYCQEHGELRVISSLSPKDQKELLEAFDVLVAEKVLSESAVAEVLIMLNHQALKLVRSGSQQDRGIHRVSYGDYLHAMKRSTFEVRAGEADEK